MSPQSPNVLPPLSANVEEQLTVTDATTAVVRRFIFRGFAWGRYIVLRVGGIVGGIIIGLLLAEMVLRIFVPAVPVTNTPKEFLAPKKIGYVPNVEWDVVEPEFREHITINSLGYRDQEIDRAVPTIVFLGDSQTFGTGVNAGERASDYARRFVQANCSRHNDPVPNILNVAMPGASTIDERRFLVDLQRKGVNVKHIILLVSTNDHYANVQDQDDPDDFDAVEPKSEKPSAIVQWLKENRYKSRFVQLVFPRLARLKWFHTFYAALKADFGLGELVSLRSLYIDERAARTQIEATERAIRRIQELAPITVVLVPDRYRVDTGLRSAALKELQSEISTNNELNIDRESELMTNVARNMGVELIDPTDIFQRNPDSELLSYPINGHLTRQGQRLLGNTILERSSFLQKICR